MYGQEKAVIPSSLIFQLAPNQKLESVSSVFADQKMTYKCLSEQNNIFLMEGILNASDEKRLQSCPEVIQIQKNNMYSKIKI